MRGGREEIAVRLAVSVCLSTLRLVLARRMLLVCLAAACLLSGARAVQEPVPVLPVVAAAAAAAPEAAPAPSNRTLLHVWPFWGGAVSDSDICSADGEGCLDGITCFVGREFECGALKPCPEYHTCVQGTCLCQFKFPTSCVEYIKQCDIDEKANFSDCKFGLCYKYYTEEDPWTAMGGLEPFLIGGIVCFFCVAVGLCACRSLLGASPTVRSRRRISDGAQSVSSMQRWIDERLRDRPPRYDEMLLASASDRGAGAGGAGAAAETTPPSSLAEVEKPPSYDFAMAEHQTSGLYEQSPEGPPPPYSRLALTLMEEDGMGFSNPCFEGDAEPSSPGPAASSLSLTSISTLDSSSSFRSTASSCSSYASASSTGGDAPHQLLTVSQVVAIQEMMLREAAEPPGPAAATPPPWTAF